jgi:hypothetical protein
MNTGTFQTKDINDATFLTLWNDLYHGVKNNHENSLLLDLAHHAGYGYCAEDLIKIVKTSQSNLSNNNIGNGNEIE